MNNKLQNYKFGIFAETVICVYLFLTFHNILARRYKTKLGEIDIIAKKGDNLIFIEVKARRAGDDEVLSTKQMNRIINASKQYLSKNNQYNSYFVRFDLIIFKSILAFNHIKNAWSA